ncbi:MAG TPA: putative lipid II flippase FtsW [Spirochaetota bacterium]|nr:putative lipid II flippase FtsW [Spirochaetota bacterium]HRZ27204.1 putative lipid II flippase FtsW [Spirochaetota bacterium]
MDLRTVIDTRRKGESDVFLFVAVFLLAGMGIALSYSASAVYAMNTFGDSFYFLKRQMLWFAISFMALLVFQEIDYRLYIRHTKTMLLISIVLLALVLIPGIGHSVKGSARWLGFGPFRLQPSEFVKLFMVIYLVKVFSSEDRGVQPSRILVPIIVIAVMFVLIMLQPDFSTAVDLLVVSVLILFVSGFPFLYIMALFVISIPMFYLLIYQVDYRKDRLLAFINPWEDRFGIGYHIIQSFIAFKKGGFLGVGLGYGTQKIARLPEPHTDFIFAVIAEETGMVGTVLVVGLYGFLFWRGMLVSLAAPDEFGRLLAMGLTMLIAVEAYINIAVVMGSLPTTGMPLPFISYGGSSLLSNMIAAGILLNISRYREVSHPGFKLSDEVWQ